VDTYFVTINLGAEVQLPQPCGGYKLTKYTVNNGRMQSRFFLEKLAPELTDVDRIAVFQ